MESAYKSAGLKPSDLDIIEGHATVTPVGDAVEVESLKKVWGEEKGNHVIGSVKSNIGHLLTAAGSAGVIKMLLALKNNTLPPTANFNTPTKNLNLTNSPFRVLKKSEEWKARGKNIPRRAAVSAFGFGGINAHLILEEYIPKKGKK
ncbi:MAG: polyketide synthase, partial [Nitrospinota bacterium]